METLNTEALNNARREHGIATQRLTQFEEQYGKSSDQYKVQKKNVDEAAKILKRLEEEKVAFKEKAAEAAKKSGKS